MIYQPGVYAPPVAHYRHLNVKDEWVDSIAKIIGKNGKHFINITKLTGCQYLWFNEEKQVIEIWGPHARLMKAHNHLVKHIHEIMNEKNEEN